uniref:Vesicle associated membrane protein 8 n=1 Tax=Marmota marmota marmota TaxID=9994 RepID=A0A8C5Z7J2_MARMA
MHLCLMTQATHENILSVIISSIAKNWNPPCTVPPWPLGSSSSGLTNPYVALQEEAGGGRGHDQVRNLQSEVEGVKNIMTQNVERILARGENLDHLRNKTEDLEATSEHFKTTSQKVARKFWWKNVKMIVLICVVVFIFILLIVLFSTGAIPT